MTTRKGVDASIRNDYHPGNITRGDEAFRQQDEPPMSHRQVEMASAPVLYDVHARPIYRRIGFTVSR